MFVPGFSVIADVCSRLLSNSRCLFPAFLCPFFICICTIGLHPYCLDGFVPAFYYSSRSSSSRHPRPQQAPKDFISPLPASSLLFRSTSLIVARLSLPFCASFLGGMWVILLDSVPNVLPLHLPMFVSGPLMSADVCSRPIDTC